MAWNRFCLYHASAGCCVSLLPARRFSDGSLWDDSNPSVMLGVRGRKKHPGEADMSAQEGGSLWIRSGPVRKGW